MSTFQFIASLVGSLVWPTVIVIIVVVLRNPLSHIFSSLTLNKLSYKDWQFDFGDKVHHDKFGDGIVIKSEVDRGTEFVNVQFQGNYGKKRLSMAFAKLEKI